MRQAEMTSADLIPPGRSLHGRRVGAGPKRGVEGVDLFDAAVCASSSRGSSSAWSVLSGFKRTTRQFAHAYAMWASPGSRPERPRR